VTQIWHCPQCAAGELLVKEAGGVMPPSWHCSACQQPFPVIADVPWLFAAPAAALQEWRQRFAALIRRSEQTESELRARLRDAALARDAWRRIAHLADAHVKHRARLLDLLAPLQLSAATAPLAALEALQTALPLSQDLTSYYVNLHRDWVWGEAENAAALRIVRELLETEPLGTMLVPGAGAGRLSYDLHQSANPTRTVALDINPLLFWALARLLKGASVSLVEFPLAPRCAADSAIERTWRLPAPVRPGMELALGDILQPPFAAASFDTVLTPWLIDILPVSLRQLASIVARLLKPGGRWINFGSLSFAQADPAEQLTAAELPTVVNSAGFDWQAEHHEVIPYMRSPASRHARTEEITAFVARRTTQSIEMPRWPQVAPWLTDIKLAVPRSDWLAGEAAQQQIFAFVTSLVDGQRSIADIVAHLAQQRLMQPEEALPAVRGFLQQLHEQAGQRRHW
jgi:hypothetical protein